MEGLAAGASIIGVAAFAIQLADSVKKLYEFWDSIKGAPDDVRAISLDLHLLSGVLSEIASEAQHVEPDHTLEAVMKACVLRVKALNNILSEIEPSFLSRGTFTRKWTALRSVLKSEKIKKFQNSLEGLKSTLMLLQQKQNE